MKVDNKKIVSTGRHVARLKKGQQVTYLKPVAGERAKIMKKFFKYNALVADPYTLKPIKNE